MNQEAIEILKLNMQALYIYYANFHGDSRNQTKQMED